MRSVPISSDLFIRNRSKLINRLSDSALAILSSSPQMPRNGDQFYVYRQHSDFFYLSGIFQQESILVLSSSAETLFIRRPDPKIQLWSGSLLTMEKAMRFSGIRDVRWLDEVDEFLEKELQNAGKLYLSEIPGVQLYERIKALYPYVERIGLGPIMTQLRMIKEPEEVEEIRKACAITRSAFLKVVNMLKPGMMEYEVEAELGAEFIRTGAQGHAFEPIVASGSNALVLHYVENHGSLDKGDLVLLDFGAELNNYAADCSRTLPVGGKFSKRQGELYDAVHQVFIQAREMMVPGVLMGDFHKRVGELWQEKHISLGLYTLDEARESLEADPLWKKYFMHGTSHSLGMDVHDPFERSEPFAPGMVLTCEPGIYIQEEGIGIRLENDILITENGPEDLMADIPMEAGEIEDLMQSNMK
ncbi:MAG: aminopeptidase P N-terminal domain-containing protein [Bacteroides sp.]|nr:aminopeptidase P N-terminal domain-containing protein [Bacteroides sp.]